MRENDEETFAEHVADLLSGLPGVEAVALGGSRARGTHRPDSDWDFALYYRGAFDPADLRALGLPGSVSDLGEWGGGVFNGGAWLTVQGRAVDVHYRDLDVVSHELAEAEKGRFRWEPLAFHLAGIPSYLVVAELALNRVLRGELPRPEYPELLRENAPKFWRASAARTLDYAKSAYVRHGRVAETAASVGVAAMQAGHAVLAARGEWVTNEKTLLERAELRGLDDVVAGMGHDLAGAFATAGALLGQAAGVGQSG
ncbi:nucleotidyltransferase domain-containing protein [Amycolatopsis echigonensis]|uniref:Nucleotidyltransferase domain-containing protein n=1 Tax=Amycolatopsis echigonensis TaxID=2576905 RepID=A0A8E1T359_9PSEU|nr:nucleotidyltransferase domain-containing protein [Amycolatopsis echigonensis]MBB2497538.1 nucleotidyltransferase domain-containing protein [Amycolatopsis echigonensis]